MHFSYVFYKTTKGSIQSAYGDIAEALFGPIQLCFGCLILVLIAARRERAIIGFLLVFFQFKEIELNWGADFLSYVCKFYDVSSQIGVMILVTPKQEVEQKSESFCGLNFFALSRENGD